MDADVTVVGAGLAGLVATHELTSRGKKVALIDQENAANLGGQAFWSFGGLFLVDSPEQRRLRVKDSFELAWNDWQGSAQFDRLDDGASGSGGGSMPNRLGRRALRAGWAATPVRPHHVRRRGKRTRRVSKLRHARRCRGPHRCPRSWPAAHRRRRRSGDRRAGPAAVAISR
ncbi:MAG: uncharacterized protein QOF88_6673 [Mycobacterium sp.]|nr:uncharacterized protein [Mycobacterium sp.]